MKKTILLLFTILISSLGFAQEGFNYKALVTNNGNPVTNSSIDVKVTIKNSSGTIEWKEEHSNVSTDANGIFSITIGTGTRISGAPSFDEIDWQPDFTYSVSIDTGTGYTNLVSNEPLNSVPYAALASGLAPLTDKGIRLISTNNDIYHGYRLSKGYDDWYIYMKNSDFYINNDGTNVLKINDSNNTIQMLKPLEVSTSGITFDASGTNKYYIKYSSSGSASGLAFKYNNSTAMLLHGGVSVEVLGKLRAPDSGDSDMKAYLYGDVKVDGTISSNGSTSGFTVSRISTGKYKITFDTPFNDYTDYIAIASVAFGGNGYASVDRYAGYMYVRTYNSSGSNVDNRFNFIIFKK